jgi:hypothetical protein
MSRLLPVAAVTTNSFNRFMNNSRDRVNKITVAMALMAVCSFSLAQNEKVVSLHRGGMRRTYGSSKSP